MPLSTVRSACRALSWFVLALTVIACSEDRSPGHVEDAAADTAPAASDADTAVGPKDTRQAADTTPAEDSGPAEDSVLVSDTTTTPDTAPAADIQPPSDTSTPAHDPVRFVVMGDAGTGGEGQHAMADTLVTVCAELGCDFILLTGDNIYDAGVESVMDSQWQTKFEEPYEDLDVVFHPVLGNHDNGGFLSQFLGDTFGGAGGEFERGDHQVAYTQVSPSGKWQMPARVYDFQAGPAHIFALDTNDMVWGELDPGAAARADQQKAVLPNKIAQSNAVWRIAFGHHPYLSNGQHGDAGEYEGLEEEVTDLAEAIPYLGDLAELIEPLVTGDGVKEGLETIACGQVDLYFSGHDHNRAWIPPTSDCPGTHWVVSGAGAKVKGFRQDHETLFEDAVSVGVFWIEIVGNTLRAKAINVAGETEWDYEWVK